MIVLTNGATAHDGACGASLTVENNDQTLPAGASQELFINAPLATLRPVRTGQTAILLETLCL
jgi:hypothetical protein